MRLRILVWIFLSIALSLAGAARSSALATALSQRIQICADGHAQEVFVDQAGNLTPGHPDCGHCPDCIPTALVLANGPLALSRITTARAVRQRPCVGGPRSAPSAMCRNPADLRSQQASSIFPTVFAGFPCRT